MALELACDLTYMLLAWDDFEKKTRDVLYVWCYISIIHFESTLYDDMIVSTDCATAISQPPGNSAISSCFIWPKLDVFQQSFPFHLEIVSSTLVKKITGMNVIHDVNFTLIPLENRSKLPTKRKVVFQLSIFRCILHMLVSGGRGYTYIWQLLFPGP